MYVYNRYLGTALTVPFVFGCRGEQRSPSDSRKGCPYIRLQTLNGTRLLGVRHSHLDLNRSNALLCLQGAKRATDCKQCIGASAPKGWRGVILPPALNDTRLLGVRHLHLDYITKTREFQSKNSTQNSRQNKGSHRGAFELSVILNNQLRLFCSLSLLHYDYKENTCNSDK